MSVQLVDRAEIRTMRQLDDGRVVVTAFAAKGGNVQRYLGSEVGMPDREFVDVYRPVEEVFHKDSMASAAYKAVTLNHPQMMVDSSNWKELAIGFTSGDVARDGDFISIPMMLTDGAAIKDAAGNQVKECSVGYTCDLDFTAGTTEDGKTYDAVQRKIRWNHLAIVKHGRANQADEDPVATGDTKPQPGEPKPMNLQKVMVDGIEIDATPQAAQVIAKLQKQLGDADTAAGALAAEHAEAIASKDAELGTKDAEIAELKKAQLTAEQMDAAVAERAAVVAKAEAVGVKDTAGKSNDDIRRAAVAAKFADMDLTGKSSDYVQALFDGIKTGDPMRPQGQQHQQPAPTHSQQHQQLGDAGTAYADMMTGLSSAWNGENTNA